MVKIGIGLAIFIFLLGVAFALYFSGKDPDEDNLIQNSIQKLQAIVLEEIKNVSELATFRKNFKSTLKFEDVTQFLDFQIPGTSRKFSMDYTGTIVCGCDLSKIRIEREENSKNRVKITVPQSKILDIYADVNSFKIHSQEAGIFAENIKIEEQNELIAKDLESQKKSAIQDGIIELSNENIRQVLTSIIAGKNLDKNFQIDIEFLSENKIPQLQSPPI